VRAHLLVGVTQRTSEAALPIAAHKLIFRI
jgi:hypothetical protein